MSELERKIGSRVKKTVKLLVLGTTLVIGVGLVVLLNKYNNKVILLDID